MARPIWKGGISFGLVYIPVTLFSAEHSSTLPFHLLDKRNHARIRYQRINEQTGKPVPWENIVKGYEFEKDHYILIEESEFEKTASESSQVVDIQSFVDHQSLDSVYFEKPYYLVPSKQGEKPYILLRETLIRTNKVGIAKVLIRTKEYLSVVIPYQNSLVLNLLRFPEEIRKPQEYSIPTSGLKSYKLGPTELKLAEQLVKAMSTSWDPKNYRDESHALLTQWIDAKIKKKKVIASPKTEKKRQDNHLIDFMTILKKSIAEQATQKRAYKRKLSS